MNLYPKVLLTILGMFALFSVSAQTLPCNVNLTATTSGSGGCVSDSITIANPSLTLNNTFTFPGVSANVISGSVTIEAMGDIDLTSEYWTLLSEAGATLTTVGGSGGQCATIYTITIPLTAADLLAWSANGTIDFNVNGSADVNTSLCGNDYVEVTLETCYPTTNCAGSDVNLVATGSGAQTVIMSNDFNAGLGTGWVATGGSAVGSPCGASLDGTDYYWASTSTGTPNLTTVAYDVSCGGTITFDMAYATQGGAAPCEGPDLTDEGVTLQYSTDGGATWIVIDYWDPLGGYDPTMTAWNTYTYPIPPGAMTPNTQFQWIQNNSSGTCCDNWGIDNVYITANTNCNSYWYDYDHLPGAPDAPTDMQNVTTNTTFGVWYTNGIDSCYATTTVIVPPGATADAGPDVTMCAGSGPVTIGADPVSPDDGSVYTWSTGATGTIDVTGGTDNGQTTVNPLVQTDYYLEVDFNSCTAYDTVTVFMDNPPTASNPANINVECAADVPAPDVTVVTDENDDITIPPTVTHVGDVSDGLSCPETITRTYRVTDACGSYVDVQQLIIIEDLTSPVFAAPPADVTVECAGDVPAMTDLAWTDNCDGAGTVTGTDGALTGGTCGGTITRTWTYTDACGNTATATQTITVNDTQVPVFAAAPADVTVECSGDVPAMTDLTWTDNCDGTGTVTGTDGALTGGTCGGTITRTWTYTDACGNTATVTQTITINDTQAPVFAAPPADVTVECVGDVPAMTGLAWTDNCDGAGTVTGVDGALTGGPCGGTITRTWTYTDACGNSATVTQTITVDDTTPPTASNPAPIAVAGGSPVPPADVLAVTDEADNCSVPVVAHVSDVSDGLNCPETITRTFSVTDACGNTINVIQLITIGDAVMPTASNPAAINVECIGDVPAPDPVVVTDEADNGGVPTVTWEDDTSDGNTCPETIDRRYRVTDNCGNFIFVTQTITVQDVTNPVFNAPPANVTVECVGDVPAMTGLDWTDNCDGTGTVTGNDVSDGLSCPETITRTWTYTDACGNTATETQSITVIDTQVPVFAAPPANVTVECIGDVPAMTDLAWTDNCDGAGTVTGTDGALTGGNCGGTITRTWTYTDACGNSATVTQTITVDDTTPPTASNLSPISVTGIGAVPPANILDVTDEADNCGTPVVAHVSDVSDGLNCPETITRTYSVTDACGNSITVTQLITVGDPIAPTASNPAPISVECIGDVPAPDPLVVTDEADNGAAPVVTWEDDTSDGNTCPETIDRRYRVTDDCGNFIFVTQTITVHDITAPVFNAPPANVTVECIGDVPAMADLGWTDNCDGTGTVTGSDVSDGLSCPETITRTWTYTDACGNTSTETQTITVIDTQAPVFNAPPANVTVECIADVPAMTNLDWTDNCDGTGTVTGSDVSDGLSCPETITRTWTYTDACGNVSTETQIITVHDTQAPVFDTPPADITIECVGGLLAANMLGWTDNCDGAGAVMATDGPLVGGTCGGTITRTWTYTDACGNTATVTQTITVDDTTPPTASNPATTTVPGGPAPAVDPTIVDDEADNCTVNPTVTFISEVSDNNPCPETITRTYRVTDDCGNFIDVTHTILITDPILPTATAPAAINVECIGDVPAADPLVITDEADNQGVPTVAWVGDVSDGQTCPETITRTYSITDVCGNVVTVDQIITVLDVTPPTATAPVTVNVECIGDVPVANIADITDEADNCTANPVVAHVGDVSDGLSCPETITRTYSITDDCGNSITVDQLIIVSDITPPTASDPADISVPGPNDVPAPDPSVVIDEQDNCTVSPTVTWVSDVSDGNVCNLEKITRTYEVTDECGNSITVSQVITILAVPPPIDAGVDQTICAGDLVTIQESNPAGATISWSPTLPLMPFAPTQTQTYVVTADLYGCISEDSVTVTIEEVPTVSFVGDNLSGCSPVLVTFTNTSTAPSGISDCEWLINGEIINGCGPIQYQFNDPGTYDITLTTTSGTGCVASDTYTDYIYVEADPVASFTASDYQLTNINTNVQFTNTTTGAVDYIWDFGDNLGGSTQTNPSNEFPYNEGGSYEVTLYAYSPLQCVDSVKATISVVEEVIYFIPNTFTPDGDNYNEYFRAIFTSGYDPYDFELLIFNRWGELIWESHDDSVGWDGTYGGEIVQDGTYTWKIEFKTTMTDERITVRGHVNVIR